MLPIPGHAADENRGYIGKARKREDWGMEVELVMVGQIIAVLAVSAGTLFALSAQRENHLKMEPTVRQAYVDRMGR